MDRDLRNGPINTVIVARQSDRRRQIADSISNVGSIRIVENVPGTHQIEAGLGGGKVDVVLLEVEEDHTHALESIRNFRQVSGAPHVVVLSHSDDSGLVRNVRSKVELIKYSLKRGLTTINF